MQFLTQLCAKKKKATRKVAYEDASARRYWSIHELIVILSAHAMYGYTKEVVDYTTWEHFLFSFNNSGNWVFNNTVRKW